LKQNLKQAQINLDSSLFSDEANISKAEIDYNNLIKANKQQIIVFETTASNDYLALKNLFTDIIDFSDNLL